MKVLHTNFLQGWGGQSNRILTECEGLAAKGWDVLISAPPKSQLIQRAEKAGLAVHKEIGYAGGLRLAVIDDVRGMRRLLKEYQPDIIHLHGGRDSWVFAKAMLTLPRELRPIVIRTKHNIFPISDNPFNRWMYGRCFDSIVSISSAITRQMAEKSYINESKIVLIPSAIDATRFEVEPGTRQRVRAELGFSDEEIIIGIVGRLRREKAHDVLFAAVPDIVKSCPQARIVCFGSGSLSGEFQEMLRSTGTESYVHMAGFRKDIPECLSALDIYTQPSRSEGLGTSVLEACAAALPVVASDSGGIPDIIEHEKTGLLVPVENDPALAAAIIRMINNLEWGRGLGEAAREKIHRVFGVEALVEKTDTHYREMLAKFR